jgi:RNA polymerase sigma-70 factor (ECF subfamily)
LRRVKAAFWSSGRSGGRVSAVTQGEVARTLDYAALVRRIGAGERPAESEFVAVFGPGVRALVRRHARPADPIVDDLSQNVLQHVLEQLRRGALNDPHALPAYLRNAVVFEVRAEYRRRGRRGEDATQPVDDLAAADDPERQAQRDQLARLVREVLAELPVPRDREILRLHYLAEEDRDAICSMLGIDSGHFHRVLFRARERLKQRLVEAGVDME